MSVQLCCDFCGMPLPKTMVEDPEGRRSSAIIYFTKELNTKKLFPHLCENCATNMDGIAGYFDNEIDAEDLVSWIKDISLSCDFDVYVETITLGELDKDFISYVIS